MINATTAIKDRLSIVDVVGSYITLEKAGKYYRARCPFHSEKTPSFIVSPDRNTFHCFGCAEGGDIFSFVTKIEGVSFYEALQSLAEKAGVKLSSFTDSKVPETKNLFKVLEDATRLYEYVLLKRTDVLEYLHERGLTDESIKAFQIGYAPRLPKLLTDYLTTKKKHSLKDIENVGLASHNERGAYDRFRSRIMFPIAASTGKVVGFSGRLYDKNNTPQNVAKYINSPETELYHKSRVLFGYDKAKQAILQEKFVIVVEGQFDLVMAHQAGTKNTVAVSGTALTEEHLQLLKRFTDTILFAFDSDSAGEKASEKGYLLATELGFTVKFVSLPKGKDPADCIKESKESWFEAIKSATHIIIHRTESLMDQGLDLHTLRSKVSEKIIPYIARLTRPIKQAHFIQYIAEHIGLAEDVIRKEVESVPRDNETRPTEPLKPQLEEKDYNKLISEKIRTLILLLEEGDTDISRERAQFEGILGHPIDTTKNEGDQVKILEMEYLVPDTTERTKMLEELLLLYEKFVLEQKIAELRRSISQKKISEAESSQTLEAIHTASRRVQEIKDSLQSK